MTNETTGIIKQIGESGFLMKTAKLPRREGSDKRILLIKMSLVPAEENPDPAKNAVELFQCLSLISSDVLKELKKMLPDS